jgi:hypothetical protein
MQTAPCFADAGRWWDHGGASRIDTGAYARVRCARVRSTAAPPCRCITQSQQYAKERLTNMARTLASTDHSRRNLWSRGGHGHSMSRAVSAMGEAHGGQVTIFPVFMGVLYRLGHQMDQMDDPSATFASTVQSQRCMCIHWASAYNLKKFRT